MLSGVRILDFGHVVTGSFATSLLADFGADVIKVESATAVEPGRRLGPFGHNGPREPDGSALFASLNRNKRSVAINLKSATGLDIAVALARESDALVENFSVGVMERLGLGSRRMLAMNPGLIYLSMAGLGHGGPHAGWVSFNVVIQALSGQMLTTGKPEDPPVAVSNSWADFVAGLHGALTVMAALARREQDGRGCWIDLSQYEANMLPLGHLILASQRAGSSVGRMGNRSATRFPQGCYRCEGADAWCALSVGSDQEWRALVSVLADEDLADPRYDTPEDRCARADEIDRRIEAWTRDRPAKEVERRLQHAGIAAAAVRSNVEVMAELSRFVPSFRSMQHPVVGTVPVLPNPIHFEGEPAQTDRAGPLLGQHTGEVLHQVLGMSAVECERLRVDGVLV
jgi:crotonobetainyl-CoA:carnitine CoA-transferase CaiB-like acyl-CoA transferase